MGMFRRNRSFMLALAAVTVLGSVIGLDNPLRGVVTGGVRSMTAVVWEAAYGVRQAFDIYGGISSRTTLAAQNKSLREEVRRLQSLSLHNDVLRAENATLRDMFSLREAHPEGKASSVLSNPSASPYGTFVIGSGTDEGVAIGDFILSAPRVAIGRVIETEHSTALVELFSAPGRETEVVVNDVRAPYVGRGDGNGLITVARGVSAKEGDAAQLPGLPFAIGFVGFVESDPEDAEAKILIRVPANLPSLSFVYVVPSP